MNSPAASALYEGTIRHRRMEPVEHSFTYPLFMAYLDLAELPEALDGLGGWSARRPALAWFRRSDFLEPADRPLDEVVRDRVEAELGDRPAGPIRLLTNLRYFGHSFNPVSFYFCFDAAGERPVAVLADVTNTPWGESHSYAIAADGGRLISARIAKRFHVSPLMGMDHVYEWRTTAPGEEAQVHISSSAGERLTFDATLALRRRELAPDIARRMLIRYPAMTLQVLARIYWQALRLRLKGAPWHAHPERG